MKLVFDVIQDQKFNIFSSKDFMQCLNCSNVICIDSEGCVIHECNKFLSCDNYSKLLTRHIYSVVDFIEEHNNDEFNWYSKESLDEFFDCCVVFPQNVYYDSYENNGNVVVDIVRLYANGKENVISRFIINKDLIKTKYFKVSNTQKLYIEKVEEDLKLIKKNFNKE